MPRYDIKIELKIEHTFAVEAADPMEAQAVAFGAMGERTPEQIETHIEVERGSG